jgi:hypothetical protein
LVYEKFYNQVKTKYKVDNGLSYLNILNKALETAAKDSKINKNNVKVFSDLQKLNNEKIFTIELENKEKVNKQKIENNPLLKNYKNFSYNNDALVKEN